MIYRITKYTDWSILVFLQFDLLICLIMHVFAGNSLPVCPHQITGCRFNWLISKNDVKLCEQTSKRRHLYVKGNDSCNLIVQIDSNDFFSSQIHD